MDIYLVLMANRRRIDDMDNTDAHDQIENLEEEMDDNQEEDGMWEEEDEDEDEEGEPQVVLVQVPQQPVKVETEEERVKREEAEKIKRAKIFEIQRNPNLTDREKSIAIKTVISGKTVTEKTSENQEFLNASFQV